MGQECQGDKRDRTGRIGNRGRTARTWQPGQDRLRQGNQDGTTVAVERGHLGQDQSDRTACTGEPGKDRDDSRTARI